ncbi:MAG: sigma-70 family RNA polymerase sigma factor [Candidatus Dadabacteria bacterium]
MERLENLSTTTSESDIIQKILDGERALFEILIRRYNPVLYKVARSYGFSHQDAQDLMQDTYITVYLQLASFEHRSSFKTWITKILIHKCLYKLNYGYYKREITSEDNPATNTETMQTLNSKSDTERAVANREFAKLLETHLEQLPVIYRSVFVLREVEGFSIAETAELLNISHVNVKVRLNRSKVMLQKKLESYYSASEIYEFNAVYCNAMVNSVFAKLDSMGK